MGRSAGLARTGAPATSPPAPSYPRRVDQATAPGADLGLPATGAGRLASWGSRIAALIIDWFASLAASLVFASRDQVSAGNARWVPLVVLVVESALLTASLGGSFGQLLLGVRVRRVDRTPLVGIGRSLLRSVLIALVLPAVIFDQDRRGLHDRAAGTVVVRVR